MADRMKEARKKVADDRGPSLNVAEDFQKGIALIGALLAGSRSDKTEAEIRAKHRDTSARFKKEVESRQGKVEKATGTSGIVDPLRKLKKRRG